MRLKADLTLLLVAVIWGSAFIAQRVAADWMDLFVFNGLRFLLGALLLALVTRPAALVRRLAQPLASVRDKRFGQKMILVGITGGALYLASALQQAGLAFTTAGNAGFFTSLYVIFIPFLLWVFWRRKVRWLTWAAALLAVCGAFLLSTGGTRLHISYGDGLEIVGAVMWGLHVILVGQAVRRMDVLAFSVGQFVVAGMLNLVTGLLVSAQPWAGLADAWWTVVYIGVFSTAIAYTLQAMGQRYAPPADAAILLSLEAVFAALFGYWLLSERLLGLQLVGCGLILAGVLLAQLKVE